MFVRARRQCLHLRLLLLLVLGSVLPSLGYGQVHFVYRFDTRPPDVIFAEGFSPRGQDGNLLLHVLTREGGSAFIATTSSYDAALRFARAHFQGRSASVGYIYEIAADQRFYAVTPSMEAFLRRERAEGIHPDNERALALVASAIDDFRWEREFVALGSVAPSSIYWAVEVRAIREPDDSVRVEEGDYQIHADPSRLPNTSANPQIYPVTWPGDFPSAPVCANPGDNTEEAAGPNCTDDQYVAVQDGYYVHPDVLPSCSAWHRPPRSVEKPMCAGGVPLINRSKLARIRAAIVSGMTVAGPEQAGY